MREGARTQTAPSVSQEATLPIRDQWRIYCHFMRFVEPYHSKFVLVLFLLFVGTPLTQISLFLTRNLTDEVVLAGSLTTDTRLHLLWVYIGAQAALFFSGYLLELVRETMVWFLEWRVGFDLRTAFYQHLHRLPIAFFRSRSIGEQMFRATGDILWGGGIVYLITRGLASVLQIIYSLIWTIALIALIDPWLTLAVFLYIVPYTLVREWLVRRQRPLSFRLREAVEAETAALRDSIAGLRTVKSMGRTGWAARRFLRAAIQRRRIEWQNWVVGFTVNQLLLWMLTFVFERWLWLYIAWRVIHGELTIGDWLVVFGMVNGLRSPLQYLISALQNIRLQLVSGQRILETLEVVPTISDPPNAVRLGKLSGDIVFERVAFSYSPTGSVLHEIDLHFPAGTHAAFVGSSGAGKSTLVALLLRLYDPTAGAIRVDGHDLRSVKRGMYLEQLAVVPQETFLFSGTIAENLRYSRPDASNDDLRRAADSAGALEFIDALPDGFETQVGSGTRLSGGQKQRLGIARALVRDPRILLLDEPTANLDVFTEREILKTLERLGEGRTVITIAHRLPTVEHCDVIIVLDKGLVADRGTHQELLSRPGLYHELWREQMGDAFENQKSEASATINSASVLASSPSAHTAALPPVKPIESRTHRAEWNLFRQTLGFLHPYRRKVWLLALLGAASATLDGLSPLLAKPLIDQAFPQRNWSLALQIFGVLAGFELLRQLFAVISDALGFYVGQRLRLDLRSRFYRQLQRLSLTVIDQQSVGEQMYRNTADVDAVAEMVSGIVPSMVSLAYTVSLTLVFTTFLDPWVALFVVVYLVPYAFLQMRFTSIQRSLDRDERRWSEASSGRLHEGIAGVLTVKMLGRHRREVAEYTDRNIQALRIGIVRYGWLTLQHFTTGVVMPFAKDKAIWAYFAYKVILGEATFGAFVPVIAFADRLSRPVQQLIEFANAVRQTLIPAERLMETLQALPALVEASDSRTMPPLNGEVCFENVSFAYESGEPVLSGIDFHLTPGRRIAIVGLSGAGKSTLLSLLLRLNDPTAGCIKMDGQDLRTFSHESYQRQVGVVLQETFLFSGTVAENLRLTAPEATEARMEDAAQRAGIAEWIQSLPSGYHTDLHEGTALSPGQKQRLGIARALISQPRLLLLDEPTSSLDACTEAAILAALWDAAQDRTLLLVTHRLNTVFRADEIWVMAGGRIVQSGPHEKLLSVAGPFRDLWQAHQTKEVQLS